MATGQPWEYFAEQDDAILATYGEVLEQANKAAGGNKPNATTSTAPQGIPMRG